MVLRCNEVAVDLVTVKSFELNASHCLKQTGELTQVSMHLRVFQ